MSVGDFKISDKGLLMIRLGPMNGQIQVHRNENAAPCRRGIWCFVHGQHDPFFYCHIWEKWLPKKFLYPRHPEEDDPDYEAKLAKYKKDVEEFDYTGRAKKLREISKEHPPKKFWHNGGFYSYIKPHKNMTSALWYWYDSPRAFVDAAKKQIIANKIHNIRYSSDHLQLFIPC